MKAKSLRLSGAALLAASCCHGALHAQQLPTTLDFDVRGAFKNPVWESANSALVIENNLSGGYSSAFDLTDAPAALNPAGAIGSAAFQWGKAATWTDYPHPSALWFEPLAAFSIAPEESFSLGLLHYRNGTITSNSGASWIDLELTLTFASSLELDPLTVSFGKQLINTINNDDPVASADIVSLSSLAEPLTFLDSTGNSYFLELTFRVDNDTIDGSLSTPSEFRVFEGMTGRAELLGRFTTSPVAIPEPSTAAIAISTGFFLTPSRWTDPRPSPPTSVRSSARSRSTPRTAASLPIRTRPPTTTTKPSPSPPCPRPATNSPAGPER